MDDKRRKSGPTTTAREFGSSLKLYDYRGGAAHSFPIRSPIPNRNGRRSRVDGRQSIKSNEDELEANIATPVRRRTSRGHGHTPNGINRASGGGTGNLGDPPRARPHPNSQVSWSCNEKGREGMGRMEPAGDRHCKCWGLCRIDQGRLRLPIEGNCGCNKRDLAKSRQKLFLLFSWPG